MSRTARATGCTDLWPATGRGHCRRPPLLPAAKRQQPIKLRRLRAHQELSRHCKAAYVPAMSWRSTARCRRERSTWRRSTSCIWLRRRRRPRPSARSAAGEWSPRAKVRATAAAAARPKPRSRVRQLQPARSGDGLLRGASLRPPPSFQAAGAHERRKGASQPVEDLHLLHIRSYQNRKI